MSTDEQLLTAWRRGDKSAGASLFDRHFPSVHAFFRNKLTLGHEDAVQRTFAAALEKRDTFAGRSSFRTWLLGIARFELFRIYRERGKVDSLERLSEVSVHDLDPSPSAVVARRQEQRLLLEGLRRLSLDDQIVLELRYWEQMPVDEVADLLGVAPGTVKSRLGRARGRLQELIGALTAGDVQRTPTVSDLDAWCEGLRAIVRGQSGNR